MIAIAIIATGRMSICLLLLITAHEPRAAKPSVPDFNLIANEILTIVIVLEFE
jgi:hypothetical protein